MILCRKDECENIEQQFTNLVKAKEDAGANSLTGQ